MIDSFWPQINEKRKEMQNLLVSGRIVTAVPVENASSHSAQAKQIWHFIFLAGSSSGASIFGALTLGNGSTIVFLRNGL